MRLSLKVTAAAFFGVLLLGVGALRAQQNFGYSIPTISPFYYSGGNAVLSDDSASLKVPALSSLDCIGTDGNGVFGEGTCVGGSGSGDPNLIYRALSGTKYYAASSSASDNLAFHFNNGFVSSASSSIAGTLNAQGILSKGFVVSTSTTIGSDNAQFTSIQTALTANGTGLNIKNGTYSEQLTLANNKTKITGESPNALIYINGATQNPGIDINGKTEVRLDGITVSEVNALPLGVGVDFSDTSLGRLTFSRFNNFATTTLFQDASSLTFYNLLLGNTFFNCGYACQDYSGTQANANNSAFNRMRPMQTPEQGYGIFLNDTRGFSSFGDDIEGTTTANNVIGVYQGISSRDNNFYGLWNEANTYGVKCASGTVRLGIFGGTVSGNGTDVDPNCIGANTFLNVNVTGTTLNTIGTRLGVATSTSYDASPQHVFGVEGASLFHGNVELDGNDIALFGSGADITSDTDLDIYPGKQTSRALRVTDSTTFVDLSAIGSVPLRIDDSFYVTNGLYASSTLGVTGTTTIEKGLQVGTTVLGDNLFKVTGESGRIYSNSVSVGGLVNITNTNSDGAGLVLYNNDATPTGRLFVVNCDNVLFDQACQHIAYDGSGDALSISSTDASSNALSVSHSGKDHALSIGYTGVRANKGAASFTSSATSSTVNISGNELGQGTIKITHTGTGADGNASGISIDLAGSGTAAQGIFIDATGGGTTGKLLNLRNNGTEYLNLTSTGTLNLLNGGVLSIGNASTTVPEGSIDLSGDIYIGGARTLQATSTAARWIAPYHGGFIPVVTSQAFTASRVLLTEFEVLQKSRVDQMCYVVGSASHGSVVMGIYGPVVTEETSDGTSLITQTASTTQGSINSPQCINLNSVVTLKPGRYYMALQGSDAVGTYMRNSNQTQVTGWGQFFTGGTFATLESTPGSLTNTGSALPGIKLRVQKP